MTKIIDKAKLFENYGEYGNEFIVDIINMFFEEYTKDIYGIREAIMQNDAKKLDFHAHKIKSSFKNFSNSFQSVFKQIFFKGWFFYTQYQQSCSHPQFVIIEIFGLVVRNINLPPHT